MKGMERIPPTGEERKEWKYATGTGKKRYGKDHTGPGNKGMERIKLAQERTGKDPRMGEEKKEKERSSGKEQKKKGTHEHKREKKGKSYHCEKKQKKLRKVSH